MSVDGWHTLLVLGGIRSGKSEFAEALLRDTARVRYVATAASRAEDPEWSARIARHRDRRPPNWTTEEIGTDPSRLAQVITAARADETLLVDDLGGWVSVLLDPAHQPADDLATIAELAAAIRGCAARLVLVSPEVGLAMVPLTPLGRAFTDALGATNQAVAGACDAVVLVVAGQPSWLKPDLSRGGPAVVPAQGTGPGGTGPARESGSDVVRPAAANGAGPAGGGGPTSAVTPTGSAGPATAGPAGSGEPVFKIGMDLPMPDESAGRAALDRLGELDFPGAGLGHLDRVVRFAAATQGAPTPVPWRSVRVLLIHGDHAGGAAAGVVSGESTRRADQARAGTGPLAALAAQAGATLQVVAAPPAAPMEDGPVLSDESVESALRYGWRVVAQAAAEGVPALVLAACGAGAETAAAAVLAATAGAEPATVLGRVVRPGGRIDDAAWMVRCATVRDALHRTRHRPRDARGILAELAGGDIAVATGVLLSAAAHRLPVLLDGPVGIAAGLVSRDLGGQARHWCLLPDHGDHPGVRFGADVLDLEPLLALRLDLGEGAAALAALPLLRSALLLAAATPTHHPDPEPAATDPAAPDPAAPDPAAPDPAVPDPTTADPAAPDPVATDPAGPDPAARERAAADPAAPEPAATGPDSGGPDPDPAPDDRAAAEDGRRAAEDDGEFVEPEPAGPGPARTARPGG